MPVGIRIGVGRRRRKGVQGPATDAAITGVRAEGWSLDFTSPPTMDPVGAPRYVALTRQGFTTAGGATTYAEAIVLTQRVRQAYPNQAILDASRVALADYAYATDTIVGGSSPANSSTETSPKPIARWATADRRMVGATLRLEIVAAHRNARNREQIAAVRFIVTDGTTTVTSTVAASTILGGVNDRQPVIGYAADIDVSTLAEGQITANAEVYPWIGGAASVLRSADSANGTRSFCPQIYRKGAARTVLYAYVDTTGNDTSGVASSNFATASATPCLTVAGAIAKLRAADGATITDGHIVRLKAGTQALGTVAAVTHSSISELTIEADPAAGSTPVFNLSAGWGSRHAYLRLRNLTIARTGTSQISGSLTPSFITIENCTYQNGGGAAAPFSGTVWGRWQGVAVTGANGSLFGQSNATIQQHLMRGMTFDAQVVADFFCSIGNIFVNGRHETGIAANENAGGFVGFNRFNGNTTSNPAVFLGAFGDVSGFGIIQNLVETTGTAGTAPAFRFSGDANTGNITHLVCHHNTLAGAWSVGRGNLLYVDTAGTGARVHKLCSFVGNIHVSNNTKHDVFALAAGNVGGWAYLYGVGCRGEFSQYVDAANGGIGSSFAQAYPGLGASLGANAITRNDPLFTDYKGTTVTGAAASPVYTAGAGGGTYTLQASSPASGRVSASVLRFNLAGVGRPAANDAAGAY